MARLVNKTERIELKDGAPMRLAAEQLGVPFGCCAGMCGTCLVKIVAGQENLSRQTVSEQDLKLKRGFRLACQARIKKGIVKIKF